jgi:hypothetical protein
MEHASNSHVMNLCLRMLLLLKKSTNLLFYQSNILQLYAFIILSYAQFLNVTL